MKNILAPSILSADFNKLGEQVKLTRDAGAKYLHFDVMDGHFVPNISIGIPVLESVSKATDMVMDVHLMIEKPERYFEAFAKAGADIINFHIETTDDPAALIAQIKKLGKLPAITVKPNTDIESVYEYIDQLHMVLIMSVEPGFGGQAFIPDALRKSKLLRAYAQEKGIDLNIEMDGGINIKNVQDVLDSGTNIVVVGSAIFGAPDITECTKSFVELIK